MARARIQLVAWALAAVAAAGGCGGSGGDGGPESSSTGAPAGDTTLAPSTTASSDQVDEALAAPLTFVHPQLDAGRTATATIGAAGGQLTLDLSSDPAAGAQVTAVFTVPPDALDQEVPFTLVAVDALDSARGAGALAGYRAPADESDTWFGVEVLPAGVSFPLGDATTVTFSGVDPSFAESAIGWDGDGVAHAEVATVTADGDASFTLQSTGGVGGGDAIEAAMTSAFGESLGRLRELLRSEQTNDAIDLVRDRHDTFVVPLIKAAIQQCGDGLTVAYQSWSQVERMAQLIGAPSSDVQELRPVIEKMASCAREACTTGDPAAAGQYWYALGTAMSIGVFDEPTYAAMSKEATQGLLECGTWRLTMLGVTEFSAASWGTGFEAFSATGLVKRLGKTLIPMRVTSRNNALWQTAFGVGLATALGGAGAANSIRCTIGPYGPSALRITADVLPPAQTGNPDEPPQPVITFEPLVNPATVDCGGSQTFDDATTLLFLTPLVANHLSMVAGGLRHTFVASEYDGMRWEYREEFVFPSSGGGTGNGTITMSLQPAGRTDPSPAPDTTGLYDLAPILAEIVSMNP